MVNFFTKYFSVFFLVKIVIKINFTLKNHLHRVKIIHLLKRKIRQNRRQRRKRRGGGRRRSRNSTKIQVP